MPYARRIRFESALLGWHDLQLLGAAARWSDEYRVETPRLVVPAGGWVACLQRGRHIVCDRISPLWLDPAEPYRLQQPQRGQRSQVLLLRMPWPSAMDRRPQLSPPALLALEAWSARLAQGPVPALALEEAVLAILDEGFGHGMPGPPHRAVERAREYLAADPGAQVTLADVAAAAACSPFHLARAFRRATGSSLHAYRTRLRMAVALQRLRDGEDRLAVLAAELGYASHSHFSAAFRRWHGLTPTQLRRQLSTISTAHPMR